MSRKPRIKAFYRNGRKKECPPGSLFEDKMAIKMATVRQCNQELHLTNMQQFDMTYRPSKNKIAIELLLYYLDDKDTRPELANNTRLRYNSPDVYTVVMVGRTLCTAEWFLVRHITRSPYTHPVQG